MTELFLKVSQLFIIIIIAYTISKFGKFNDKSTSTLSVVLNYITIPALTLYSFSNINLSDNTIFLELLSYSLLFYLIVFILTFVIKYIFRIEDSQLGTYKFMTMFSNTGFMGYPLVIAIFGIDMLYVAVILNILFNILVYTIGVIFINGNSNLSFKTILTPALISTIIGILIAILNIDTHSIVNDTLYMLGSVTTPLSMIIIGISLSNISIKEVLYDIRLICFSIFKLLVIPLFIILLFSNIFTDNINLKIFFIQFSTPVAAITVILSTHYEKDIQLASKGVFLTTLLSLITIPIIAWLVL